MARIGSLFIGGRHSDGSVTSGFVCKLEKAPNVPLSWDPPDNPWEVEAMPGVQYIVARTSEALSPDLLIEGGIGSIFRALDTFAVNQHQVLMPSKPRRHFKLVFQDGGQVVLLKVVNFRILMTQTLKITKKFEDGTTEDVETVPKPPWHQSFRYYRLSQVAADVYEAYRNVYLALEALCSEVIERHDNERESDWMKRCFRELHGSLNLADLAPTGCAEPGDYLYEVLYKDVRCNLFHAKAGTSILPFLELDGGRVASAYQKIVQVYRRAGAKHLGFSESGGIFTHAGFKHMMDRMFTDKPGIAVTDDPAPLQDKDVDASPSGRPIIYLSDVRYLGQSAPGIVLVRGSHSNLQDLPAIWRTCLLNDGKLFAGSETAGGLNLEAIDRFQCDLYIGLVQGNQPKDNF